MDKVLASQEAELVCLEPMSKVPQLPIIPGLRGKRQRSQTKLASELWVQWGKKKVCQ